MGYSPQPLMRIDQAVVKRRLPFLALAAYVAALSCESADPLGGVERHVAIVAGTGQTDTVGQPLAIPYEILVTDLAGAPVAGQAVTWTVTAGGGSLSSADAASDAAGHARATHQLGLAAGLHSARAQVSGAPESPLTFSTFAVAAAPAVAVKSAGDRQSGGASATLPVPYAVRITDSYGNATAAVRVEFTALGGSVSSPSGLTAANGVVTTTHTLSAESGPDTVLAVVPATSDTLVFVSFALGAIPALTAVNVPRNYGLHDTFVRDGIAFASAWNTGVIIYDVGDGRVGGTPGAPVPIDTVRTGDHDIGNGRSSHNTWWFHNGAERRYLFVGQEGPSNGGTASGDIYVVDVSDLNSPDTVAYYHMAGAGTHNFWMDEPAQVLYAAYYNGGVVALDVSGVLSGNLATRELARIQPGGASNTYTWGVQVANGFVYAVDMLSGVWQLQRNGTTFTIRGGGNNVSERYSSDFWVTATHIYSGTWGLRDEPGNALKIWRLTATGAPQLVDSLIIAGISTVSDVQVSDDGQVLVFSAEGGTGAGLYVYSLVDPEHPAPLGRSATVSLHTATIAEIGGRRYVFAARNPSQTVEPAMVVFDITDFAP